MVFVGTGQLLGASDVGDLQMQSVYGIVDPMTGSPAFPNLRSALVPLTLTQVGSGPGTYRTVACAGTTAQCAVDRRLGRQPARISGERVNVEMRLRSGTLIVGSNVPQISACVSGGYSWLNYFNYRDGTALPGGNGEAAPASASSSRVAAVLQLPDRRYHDRQAARHRQQAEGLRHRLQLDDREPST